MHALFGRRRTLLFSSWPTLSQVHTSPDKDNNKEGLHLFPYCRISERYFPVVLLHIPLLLSQLLEGSVQHAKTMFLQRLCFLTSHSQVLFQEARALAVWRSWGVYLAQDFNHYKTDLAESICLNLIQSAYQSHTWQAKSLLSLHSFGNRSRRWNGSWTSGHTKKSCILNKIQIKL